MNLSLTFRKRLTLLALLLILGLCLSAALSVLLVNVLASNPVASSRISAVAQNLLAFISPAIIVALLSTRLPAQLLAIRRGPSLRQLLLCLGITLVSIPATSALAQACELLPWPPRVIQAETMANAAIETLLGPHNVASLIISLLIVGILTGLGEELFFRGALQQLLLSRPMNRHAAIWLAAFVFSLMHAQPVGFIPRLLLGAGFGYMAAWTASTWSAVAAHALNNALVVFFLWMGWGTDFCGLSTPWLSVLSAFAVCFGLYMLHSRSKSSGI